MISLQIGFIAGKTEQNFYLGFRIVQGIGEFVKYC